MPEWRRYNTGLAAGTSGSEPIEVNLYKAGSSVFATSSDWAVAVGDFKVSTDNGAQANIATLPAFSNGCLKILLTAGELSGKRVKIVIANAAITSYEIDVWTFGNASAEIPYDLYLPVPAAFVTGLVVSTTGGTTTLDTAASNTNHFYERALLQIVSGTGAGQERMITAWSTSRVATHASWTTNPTSTSRYQIVGAKSDLVLWNGTDAGNLPANFASLKVNSGGFVGVDWASVDGQTSSVSLSGTIISGVGSVSGSVTVGHMSVGAIADFFLVDSGTGGLDSAIPGSVVYEIGTNLSVGASNTYTLVQSLGKQLTALGSEL